MTEEQSEEAKEEKKEETAKPPEAQQKAEVTEGQQELQKGEEFIIPFCFIPKPFIEFNGGAANLAFGLSQNQT